MRIFISYRWADSEGIVDKIYLHLSRTFKKGDIFRDKESIHLGDNFGERITYALTKEKPDAILIVIGSKWLSDARLNNPDDLLRYEIMLARASKIRLIPLFIDDISLSRASNLSALVDSLRDVKGKIIRSRDPEFEIDVQELINDLRRLDKSHVLETKEMKPVIVETQKTAPVFIPSASKSPTRIFSFVIFMISVGVIGLFLILSRMGSSVDIAYEFLIDTSGSMNDPLSNGKTKYEVATDIILQSISQADSRMIWNAVRTAGGTENSCETTETLIANTKDRSSISPLENKLRQITPHGNTAYNASLDAASNDLKNINASGKYLFVFFSSDQPSPGCTNTDQLNIERILNVFRKSTINVSLCVFTFFQPESYGQYQQLRQQLENAGLSCVGNIENQNDIDSTIMIVRNHIRRPTDAYTQIITQPVLQPSDTPALTSTLSTISISTATLTASSFATETFTALPVPSNTFTATFTLTLPPTATSTLTNTWTPTFTLSPTYTFTPTSTFTATSSSTASFTPDLTAQCQLADVNHSGQVDVADYDLVVEALNIKAGELGYTLDLDVNRNGTVDAEDLQRVLLTKGQSCSVPPVPDDCQKSELTGDNLITVDDYNLVVDLLGTQSGSESYRESRDIDRNGVINGNDAKFVLDRLNTVCTE